jgi:Tat protein translocase TatB subunit
MNGTLFNLGPLEILLILILALLVFGPERLPELTRGIGSALRRVRQLYVAFVSEFRNELQPIAEEITSVTSEIQQEMQAIREAADIRSVLQPVADEVKEAVSTDVEQMNELATEEVANELGQIGGTRNGSPPKEWVEMKSGTSDYRTVTDFPTVVSESTDDQRANGWLPRGLDLDEDNPWSMSDNKIRSDRLDEDNPWRGV